MLSDSFAAALGRMGIPELEQPIFYHAPIGIRFAIGGEEPVYQEGFRANPAYVSGALYRAGQIYRHLPAAPDLLCIELWEDGTGKTWQERIAELCREAALPEPEEALRQNAGGACHFRLFWSLRQLPFRAEGLLERIIRADIGGYAPLVSNVFFVDTRNAVLFHLYDDRGADVIAADRETIRPIFEEFNGWVLEHNREQIGRVFS